MNIRRYTRELEQTIDNTIYVNSNCEYNEHIFKQIFLTALQNII